MPVSKKRTLMKIIMPLVLLVLCLFLAACGKAKDTEAKSELLIDNPLYGGNDDTTWSGDRIYFGSFEQDADETDGTEPILWRVLQVDGKKALLLTEYAIQTMPYNQEWTDTTWATSDVREWLNEDFYSSAFSDDERIHILSTDLSTADNPGYGTNGGEDTSDNVFLLQWEDLYNESYGFTKGHTVSKKKAKKKKLNNAVNGDVLLAGLSTGRVCYPTTYAAEKNALITRQSQIRTNRDGNKIEGFGASYWLLRTPGQTQNSITYVSRWGKTALSFQSPVDHTQSTIRPAMWVDFSDVTIEKISDEYYYASSDETYLEQCKKAKDYYQEIIRNLTEEEEGPVYSIAGTECSSVTELSNPVYGGNSSGEWEGDRVYFGEWKGQQILWRVLSTDDDKLLLLSEYALFERKYDNDGSNEWSSASVRKFLNKKFIANAFTDEEAGLLVPTLLEAEVDLRYGTSSGEDTEDKVFLLSYSDIMNEAYGFTGPDPEYGNGPTDSNTRVCYKFKNSDELEGMTTTAYFGRNDKDGNQVYAVRDRVAVWTTRTAGFTDYQLHSVNRWGDAYQHEMRGISKKIQIRPALVLNKADIDLRQEDTDKYPTVISK